MTFFFCMCMLTDLCTLVFDHARHWVRKTRIAHLRNVYNQQKQQKKSALVQSLRMHADFFLFFLLLKGQSVQIANQRGSQIDPIS